MAIAVLASGGGSNLQALIDRFNATSRAAARVELVISDRADAGALERARRAGIPARVVATKGRASGEVAREMLDALGEHGIQLVALAGYLKLVPAEVVRAFRERIVNIHPALLPAFGGAGYYGMRVHEAVIESGATVSGPTVHLVNEEYDRGRILAQWPVPVFAGDTADALAARVLAVEHVLYPAVIEAIAGDGLASRARPRIDASTGGLPPRQGFTPSMRLPTIDDVRAALSF
ncbi:MAG TPA: phosphoribosylglycinamide formyltransferase [Longimicrobiales bacterium]